MSAPVVAEHLRMEVNIQFHHVATDEWVPALVDDQYFPCEVPMLMNPSGDYDAWRLTAQPTVIIPVVGEFRVPQNGLVSS